MPLRGGGGGHCESKGYYLQEHKPVSLPKVRFSKASAETFRPANIYLKPESLIRLKRFFLCEENILRICE